MPAQKLPIPEFWKAEPSPFHATVHAVPHVTISQVLHSSLAAFLPPSRVSVKSHQDVIHCITTLTQMTRDLYHLSDDEYAAETRAAVTYAQGLPHLTELNIGALPEATPPGVFRLIATLKSLTALNLSASKSVKKSTLSHMAEMPKLRLLLLSNCCNTNDAAVNEIVRFAPQLETLYLVGNTGVDAKCLGAISRLTNLRTLYLSSCKGVDAAGLDHLKQLRNLETLDLSCCDSIHDNGFFHICDILSLTSLNLFRCVNISNESTFVSIGKLTQLERLDLTSTMIGTDGVAQIATLTQLRQLTLTDCMNVAGAAVARLSSLRRLEILSLRGCAGVDTASLEAGVSKLSRLQNLDLSECHIDDEGLEKLSDLASLTTLTLHGMQVGADGLAAVARMPCLQTLMLCDAMFDNNLWRLARGRAPISSLFISVCFLNGNECLDAIAAIPKLHTLDISHCGGTCVASAGLCQLVDRVPQLQCINFSGLSGCDSAVLVKVGTLRSLRSLELSQCRQVDDAAIAHLAPLSSLRFLDLESSEGVTAAGVARLKEELPDLEEVFSEHV